MHEIFYETIAFLFFCVSQRYSMYYHYPLQTTKQKFFLPKLFPHFLLRYYWLDLSWFFGKHAKKLKGLMSPNLPPFSSSIPYIQKSFFDCRSAEFCMSNNFTTISFFLIAILIFSTPIQLNKVCLGWKMEVSLVEDSSWHAIHSTDYDCLRLWQVRTSPFLLLLLFLMSLIIFETSGRRNKTKKYKRCVSLLFMKKVLGETKRDCQRPMNELTWVAVYFCTMPWMEQWKKMKLFWKWTHMNKVVWICK